MNFLKIVAAMLFCTSLAAQSYKNDFQTAENYLDSLNLAVGKSKYREVIEATEAFIRYARVRTDTASKRWVAQAWSIKGSALLQSGELNQAVECYNIALNMRLRYLGEQHLETAYSFHNLGAYALRTGKYDEALLFFQKSQSIKTRYPKEHDGTTLEIIAILFERKGDLRQASDYARRALQAFGPNNPEAINTLIAIHGIEERRGLIDAAMESLERAILICKKEDKREKLAYCLTKRGVLHLRKGKINAAINDHRTALDYWSKLEKVDDYKWGNGYRNLGNAYAMAGDLNMAMTCYEQAIHHLQNHSLEKALLLIDVGILYKKQGQIIDAMQALKNAINLLWKNHTPEYQIANAAAFTNLATCLTEQKDWSGASVYFERAERIFRKNGDMMNLWKASQLRGNCAMQREDYSLALTIFSNLLTQSTTQQQKFTALHKIALVHERTNQIEPARHYYERALTLAGPMTSITSQAFTEEQALITTALARLWLMQPDGVVKGEKALHYAELAIERSEALRQLTRSRIGNIETAHRYSEPYQIAIGICLELAKNNPVYREKAWQTAQLQKSNFIRQTLVQATLRDQPRWAANYAKTEAALEQQRKNQFWSRYHQTPSKPVADTTLIHLFSVQDSVYQQINKAFPDWNQHLRLSSSEVRSQLQAHQVLLQYQWTGQHIAVFVLRPDTFEIHTIAMPDTIAASVRQFWQYCTTKPNLIPATIADSLHRKNGAIGHFLFQQLLQPVLSDSGKTLLIVPDKYLCYLSFGALIRKPGTTPGSYWTHEYAASCFNIQYGSSAGAFWRPLPPPAQDQGCLSVAPVFYRESSLDSLENNRAEAAAVHRIKGGTILEGSSATLGQFREAASRYDVVHLATHGILHATAPVYSYLAFNRTDTGNYERLYLYEVYQMRLNARLVATTACYSGKGMYFESEGLVSLAHAFQYAGAGNVIASLWKVDDSAAPGLMASFYTQWLKKNRSIAESLAYAQSLFVKKNRHQSHPYFWAGFVVWGNAQEDKAPLSPWKWWLLGGLAAVMLLFVVNKIRSKQLHAGT